MDLLHDRRVMMGVGGAIALIAAVGVALAIRAGDSKGPQAAPPASRAGLVVETGRDDGPIDPAQPLRCFVGGQFTGMATIAQCARKNGVATNALDVGVDETGALAATGQTTPMITPLPPAIAPATPVVSPAGATATCWTHGGDWRQLPSGTLNGCVQTLFAGRCEKPGSASYGRWGDQTLRLVPGRVEISSDNRSFRTLVEQTPGGCALPSLTG